jgi:hypothetical protein
MRNVGNGIAGNNAARGLLRGGARPAVGVFSLAALAAAGWMMMDSYRGNRERTQQSVDKLKEHNDWEETEFGWGHWSGMPWMDHLAHRVFGWKQYGPYGLREKFSAIKIRVGSFFNNVIVPNLVPLGLGIAGLYGAGVPVHKPFVAIGRALSQGVPRRLVQDLGRLGGRAATGVGSGLLKLLALPFRSLTHLGIASGLVLGGAFFLKRFSDAYGHDGQRQFFRDDIFNRHEDV